MEGIASMYACNISRTDSCSFIEAGIKEISLSSSLVL
jgi:hypothetical protein